MSVQVNQNNFTILFGSEVITYGGGSSNINLGKYLAGPQSSLHVNGLIFYYLNMQNIFVIFLFEYGAYFIIMQHVTQCKQKTECH